ncbi:MAG: radical SAM protein [Desulfobacteraceae bacterium]|nr:radical SAM protein [Desulfobacteraceae bacterium]
MTDSSSQAGYLALHARGELAARIEAARERLRSCELCPRRCRVDRLAGELGVCRTGSLAQVASYAPHFGEEGPLVGSGGSGTIFFAQCNLFCVFCQNYEISHGGEGVGTGPGQLAAMMVSLQKQGCHNINFVSPSHVAAQILAALPAAIEKGLTVPLVYNSSGYDSVATLQLLDGVVDIYMPDFKFWRAETAERHARAPGYPERARAALREMHRQVGDLIIDGRGIAVKGLLVRHLIMPEGVGETAEIMHFLATEISLDTYVNVMDQYRPCGRACDFPPLDRTITAGEYREAMRVAREAGLHRFDERDLARLLLLLRE